MNNTIKKHLAGILTVLMVFSFLTPSLYADDVSPITAGGKISVSLEIKGDAQMGTVYKQDLEVEKGENAFDLLKMVTEENQIPLEYNEEWKFVTGINGLNQTDKGPNSGWLYKVNNVSPDVGAGETILNYNDHVLFFYTLDYTKEDETEETGQIDEPVDYADRSDVSAWAIESVDKAIGLGIVSGDDKGMINPKNNITRAEFVSLLLAVMEEKSQAALSGTFTDVQEDDWYAYDVEKAAKLGLVKGSDSGEFLPRESISRQDMAVILTRAYNLEGNTPKVSDTHKISAYALKSVGSVIDNKLMSGVGNDLFAPQGRVTREMAISVMIRIVEGVKK